MLGYARTARWWGLALLAGVAGCGGGGGDPSERLIGQWALLTPDGCAAGLAFTKGGVYQETYLCELNTGDFGAEIATGTYEASGDEVTFFPERSSCADDDAEPHTFGFSFAKDGDLRLTTPAAVLILQPNPEQEGDFDDPSIFLIGCYADDDSFEPRPLQDI